MKEHLGPIIFIFCFVVLIWVFVVLGNYYMGKNSLAIEMQKLNWCMQVCNKKVAQFGRDCVCKGK